MNYEDIINKTIEKNALLESAAREWWNKLSQDEQLEYIRKHPKTKLRVRAIDIPIGHLQYLRNGQHRLLTHDKGWIYFDADEKDDLLEERSRVDSFLESRGNRLNKTSNEIDVDEIMDRVIERLLDEDRRSPDSINDIYKNKIRHEKLNSGIFVPMREDKDSGSGDYSTFEQVGQRPRQDV